MNPTLSIVIPTREEERDIEATLRQFKGLSIAHEIIVSDGGSHDRTVEVARAAGAQVIENTSGVRSPSKQRNDGARAARGEFILFLDVTVELPDIERFLARALEHFKDPAVVGLCVPQWITPSKETKADRAVLAITNIVIQLQTIGSGKFMLVRRSAFQKIGGFREKLMTREDGDLFIRLKKEGRVIFDSKLYILYAGRREHAWGWPKILWIWVRDTIGVMLFDRSPSEDWAPVR